MTCTVKICYGKACLVIIHSDVEEFERTEFAKSIGYDGNTNSIRLDDPSAEPELESGAPAKKVPPAARVTFEIGASDKFITNGFGINYDQSIEAYVWADAQKVKAWFVKPGKEVVSLANSSVTAYFEGFEEVSDTAAFVIKKQWESNCTCRQTVRGGVMNILGSPGEIGRPSVVGLYRQKGKIGLSIGALLLLTTWMSGCSVMAPPASIRYLQSLPKGALQRASPQNIRVAINLPTGVMVTHLTANIKGQVKSYKMETELRFHIVPESDALASPPTAKFSSGDWTYLCSYEG